MAQESAGNWNDGVRQCERILQTIEDLPEEVIDKATSFFEGVKESVTGISETLAKSRFFSVKQSQALDNMEAAVDKWVR